MGQLKLPVGSYQLASPVAGCKQLINCYPEQARSDKQQLILKRAPGISDFCEVVGDITARGALFVGGVLYAVIGSGFYSVDSGGAETLLSGATLILGSDRVIMKVNNAGDIFIVTPANGFGYTWDGLVFQQETNPVFTGFGAKSVGFIDGYFVFPVNDDTGQFLNSGLNALTYNALDVATAEGAPGAILDFIIDHRELIFLKESSGELWYDAGNSPGSPFSRSPNGFLEMGTAARQSLVQQDNSVFWLANDKTHRRLDGGTPVRVSQHGVESAIQRMTTISDAYSMAYTQEGHLFVVLTFPFHDRTFVFDVTTGEYHERDSLLANGQIVAWRPNFIVTAYGKQLVGDSRTGRIGILDPDTHEEWGEPQRVSWTYQGVYAERNRVQHKRLELALNSGSGTLAGQGQNPLATLKVSDDGGVTFRTLPTRPIGRRGNYTVRVAWWQLGMSRDRVYRIDITDPVQTFIVDTLLEADGAKL